MRLGNEGEMQVNAEPNKAQAAPAALFRAAPAALFIVSSALLASNALLGRAAAESVPPVALAFWRWLVAFIIILPFALPGLIAHRRRIVEVRWKLLLLGGLAMGVCGANVYIGLGLTTAANTGLIYASSPVMIVVFSSLLGLEKVNLRQCLGIFLAFAGVGAVLVQADMGRLAALDVNEGDMWILTGAVAWAVFTLLLRHWRIGLPTVTLFAADAAAGVAVLAPFYAWESLIAARPMTFDVHTLTMIGGVALFASVLSFLAYQQTIKTIGPVRAGAALYVMPFWTAGLGALWLGEPLHDYHLIGAALALPGVALANWPAAKPA
jgi:drug/metabolite transporter (DMT)-like permease